MDRGSVFPVEQWQHYIEKEIGFILPHEQQQWLINAVSHTACANDLSVEALWQQVPNDPELHQQLIDSVLIPESRFFRHLPSIQFITKAAEFAAKLPATAAQATPPFRIWSVGCSAGQEVWSLAMSLAAKQLYHYRILGTDVSQTALAQAREAKYEGRQQHLIPHDCQQFINPIQASYQDQNNRAMKGTAKELPCWQVNRILRERVDFVWHNIFTKEMPTTHLQQVIICQNMLIYFRQFDQRDILNRLAAQCAVGGYLILAPGEGLGWRPQNMRRLKHVQVNGWQKVSP
ncbi:CheR family methyltransferase [Psychrobacter aestuarii]|uniref:Type 4 fimbrial methyltransferase PilK n=1 Tax=Psychrobacter aestuarii TaxID=556327 RepID=A0ABP3FIN8_9GAMM|nr:CheR family methyltransferase [Psychrobacter aestuarii]